MSLLPLKPKLIALAAMAENRVIGLEGKLPWHLPEDLKFFKRTTSGHVVLFGKTTFEGIGRALPNRINMVLSNTFPAQDGLHVVRSLSDVMSSGYPLIYVCGGAKIYEQFFSLCDEVLLTRINETYAGDTLLPAFEDLFELRVILEETERYRIERWVRKSLEA